MDRVEVHRVDRVDLRCLLPFEEISAGMGIDECHCTALTCPVFSTRWHLNVKFFPWQRFEQTLCVNSTYDALLLHCRTLPALARGHEAFSVPISRTSLQCSTRSEPRVRTDTELALTRLVDGSARRPNPSSTKRRTSPAHLVRIFDVVDCHTPLNRPDLQAHQGGPPVSGPPPQWRTRTTAQSAQRRAHTRLRT